MRQGKQCADNMRPAICSATKLFDNAPPGATFALRMLEKQWVLVVPEGASFLLFVGGGVKSEAKRTTILFWGSPIYFDAYVSGTFYVCHVPACVAGFGRARDSQTRQTCCTLFPTCLFVGTRHRLPQVILM